MYPISGVYALEMRCFFTTRMGIP